ncbi:hypothetical protein CPC735_033730 [Coccidioides posadasii C735 delta SOWgp]|uniref:Uncharacterized protein n=1 Tax=Coccidioides posadasii (strain C735) TaxID=222929 RepID=C5P5P7_COCP7|nr:hypothetical protein CPC735_033730 [Coccidioides posadasii C735 delta SOWgp]EER28037.1 hypothetical protein CPC735_033730 [Coccidioides posadasii C735 delta SOWgp]|eukprot:XP_003070182.1 hypothetical protein CPC735_033730 [Coccidioides posadasii C735 delta SOWgp]
MPTNIPGQLRPASQPTRKEAEVQKRRLRLLPRPIRTLSFSSKNTSPSPTTLSSPVQGPTRASASRTPTTALTTPPSPTPSPSKSHRPASSARRYFRPSALKKLFTPSSSATTPQKAQPRSHPQSQKKHGQTKNQSQIPTTPTPVPEPPPAQRPPLSRLCQASSSILTYHRNRILDRDERSERYCKIPLTQWNLESLQSELAEIRIRETLSANLGNSGANNKNNDSDRGRDRDRDRDDDDDDDDDDDNPRRRDYTTRDEAGKVILDDVATAAGAARVFGGQANYNCNGNNNNGININIGGNMSVWNKPSSSPSRRKVEDSVLPWLEAMQD